MLQSRCGHYPLPLPLNHRSHPSAGHKTAHLSQLQCIEPHTNTVACPLADPEFQFRGGATWRARSSESGVWGGAPTGSRAEPWSGGQGRSPPEADSILALEESGKFASLSVSCSLSALPHGCLVRLRGLFTGVWGQSPQRGPGGASGQGVRGRSFLKLAAF